MQLSGKLGSLTIPGKNLKYSAEQTLARKNLGGNNSSSSVGDAGDKPQTLSVSGIIENEQLSEWKRLRTFARAKQKDGKPEEFTISCDLAEWMDIRKVIFIGAVSLSEADGLQAKNFSFKLQEVQSVAETIEKRKAVKPAAAATTPELIAQGEELEKKLNETK